MVGRRSRVWIFCRRQASSYVKPIGILVRTRRVMTARVRRGMVRESRWKMILCSIPVHDAEKRNIWCGRVKLCLRPIGSARASLDWPRLKFLKNSASAGPYSSFSSRPTFHKPQKDNLLSTVDLVARVYKSEGRHLPNVRLMRTPLDASSKNIRVLQKLGSILDSLRTVEHTKSTTMETVLPDDASTTSTLVNGGKRTNEGARGTVISIHNLVFRTSR